MFDTRTRLSFFACLKYAARLRLSAPTNNKIGSGSARKGAAPAPQHCLQQRDKRRGTLKFSFISLQDLCLWVRPLSAETLCNDHLLA